MAQFINNYFVVTAFVRGTRQQVGEWKFHTRAEAEAFRADKVAEGDPGVSYQLGHVDRPAGLANLLRAKPVGK